MVKLYTTHCSKCEVLEKKLNDKDIEYEIESNTKEIMKLGFMSVPLLEVDDKILQFSEAISWVNQQKDKRGK